MTDVAATRPYGVLGRVLGHSYTPTIYKELAGLEYVRFEREPEDLEAFMTGDEWEGTNVTIPYKRAVMEYLDELSPLAERMGNDGVLTSSVIVLTTLLSALTLTFWLFLLRSAGYLA